jgi:hypothetical protein
MITLPETEQYIQFIHDVYPNFKIGKHTAIIWHRSLTKLKMTFEEAKEALVTYSLRGKFPPTIADIVIEVRRSRGVDL